ncbi:MAG: hypothetical protein GWN79_20715, partial [Actinobacteria bacterium]|nr:hypothetical protein [Actinomycetota bacterium]NIU21339.1 hypothetical protein [Actinomycetota bacterium]NIU69460.1 hypothetical protein [Actinomycetota bacterium]NIV89395.1 hypothetical protein [Actinomycetota bacterium]NIW31326.1 hypothetical protein [Actinomycetota bacterium]
RADPPGQHRRAVRLERPGPGAAATAPIGHHDDNRGDDHNDQHVDDNDNDDRCAVSSVGIFRDPASWVLHVTAVS